MKSWENIVKVAYLFQIVRKAFSLMIVRIAITATLTTKKVGKYLAMTTTLTTRKVGKIFVKVVVLILLRSLFHL